MPVHVATYQFPSLKKGCSSTGSQNSFCRSATTGGAYSTQPLPFEPCSESAIVNINRLYFGTSTTARVNCFVQLSTFLSSIQRYRDDILRNSNEPIVISWDEWGPTSTRCFLVSDPRSRRTTHSPPFIGHGYRILQDGAVLDFNQREIKYDLRYVKVKKQTSRGGLTGTSRNPSYGGEDQSVPGYPGRIVRKAFVVACSSIFTKDIVTSLPYRETMVDVGAVRRSDEEARLVQISVCLVVLLSLDHPNTLFKGKTGYSMSHIRLGEVKWGL